MVIICIVGHFLVRMEPKSPIFWNLREVFIEECAIFNIFWSMKFWCLASYCDQRLMMYWNLMNFSFCFYWFGRIFAYDLSFRYFYVIFSFLKNLNKFDMFSDLDTWLILEISSNHHFLIQIVREKNLYYFWLFQFVSSSYCLFRFLSPINLVYLCLWFSYYYVYTSHLVLNTVIFLLQIKNFEYFLVIIGAFIWNKKNNYIQCWLRVFYYFMNFTF